MRQRKAKQAQTIVHEAAPTTYTQPQESIAHRAKIASYQRRQQLTSVADEVAQSSLCEKNWAYPEGRHLFPVRPRMRCVDKRYPYAKGGPLLVDEPKDSEALKNAHIKATYLRELGYRFLIIEPTTTIDDCFAQLMEKKIV